MEELDALLLLAKNYERLKGLKVDSDEDEKWIILQNVPPPLVEYFKNRIKGIICEEQLKAINLIEAAAAKYAKSISDEGKNKDKEVKTSAQS